MPRTARLIVPNYPHHIIQRGHNRQSVFAGEDDYRYYLENLAEWKERLGCKVYAFCLMTNHVHLVVDPCDHARNLALLMKRLAGRQTRFVNRLESRSGTLWEGRFRSSPIDSSAYLLACCRYVEMNPVVAGTCDHPEDYPWSSCSSKVIDRRFAWLDDDPLYLDLGATNQERRRRYLEFLHQNISAEEKEILIGAVRRGQLTGGSAFVDEIESRFNRRIELRDRGRPRKSENNSVPF